MQASDWPFAITNGQAGDYGAIRFAGHAEKFQRAVDAAKALANGTPATPIAELDAITADVHDPAPADIDLNWWL